MSNPDKTMKNIKSLHNLIVSQQKKHHNLSGIERLNRFMSDIKSAGIIESAGQNGIKGRFLLIEGGSWQNACRQLDEATAPNFVMWEEGDFYTFLKKQLLKSGDKLSMTKNNNVVTKQPKNKGQQTE